MIVADNRRRQILDIIVREFIGPDPDDNLENCQENGEEILFGVPPTIKYSAGILYPQEEYFFELSDNESEITGSAEDFDDRPNHAAPDETDNDDKGFDFGYVEETDDDNDPVNLSNTFQQSAISLTVSIKNDSNIKIQIYGAKYCEEIKDSENKKQILYYRKPFTVDYVLQGHELPDEEKKTVTRTVVSKTGENLHLALVITFRLKKKNRDSAVYTFSLVNSLKKSDPVPYQEACVFQTGLNLFSDVGFCDLPSGKKVGINDDDDSNILLYRNQKDYAIGHGCSPVWDIGENDQINEIKTSVFPVVEVKSMIPNSFDDISLSMSDFMSSENNESIIENLSRLCKKYKEWIEQLKTTDIDPKLEGIKKRHIDDCLKCYQRIVSGVSLLEEDSDVLKAFRLMNRAMLMQQLHYNLPLLEWQEDSGSFNFSNQSLPDVEDSKTWPEDPDRFGKWRPFQIAFIVMNLRSIVDKSCPDRAIVDMIWFPTGGGKTEAYLGLSAFTIFYQRLSKTPVSGSTIIMRYTLRLLTTQQFQRASSLICSCELIRQENQEELGEKRITAGLWVGGSTTPNRMKDAVTKWNEIYNAKTVENPFVLLKCPWCGAEMGIFDDQNIPKAKKIIGYKKIREPRRKDVIRFVCGNHNCLFSEETFPLPLTVIDEDIYNQPPTLLIGTVDKFAILPIKPEAKSVFGFDSKGNTTTHQPPELIIQDELHLISGPLGSMVGIYETLIHNLCSTEKKDGQKIRPKFITSTATISRARKQCNALYACSEESVFQFPPPGLNADDSFFAHLDSNHLGRIYVGMLAPSITSATASIRLLASLMYAVKDMNVESESDRDPYWTNLCYFNSLRELGRASSWMDADIREHLYSLHKRHNYYSNEEKKKAIRYVDTHVELTSRVQNYKIPQYLKSLLIEYPAENEVVKPVDICLATNMVSVGVDIPRLGLMTVIGQPKTTTEYIQATSRVGRRNDVPGLIFTVYNPARPRDRSHYESFQSYHEKLYTNVEPISITPFSSPVRERSLHAVLIGLYRLMYDDQIDPNPIPIPDKNQIEEISSWILDRVNKTDAEEYDNTKLMLKEIIQKWGQQKYQKYYSTNVDDSAPFMCPAGKTIQPEWEGRSYSTQSSMRDVGQNCNLKVLHEY